MSPKLNSSHSTISLNLQSQIRHINNTELKSFSMFCRHLNNYKPQLSFYNNKSGHLNNYKPHLSFYTNKARQKQRFQTNNVNKQKQLSKFVRWQPKRNSVRILS